MAIQVLDTLIDKTDNFEVVRDQIAGILAAEVVNQMAKAVLAAKDPTLWDLSIYTERARPWEALINDDGTVRDAAPVVNVYFDNVNFPQGEGSTIDKTTADGIFHIDVYATATSANNVAGGYVTGDEAAARELQRAIRLVRNVLGAARNAYLQLRGTVGQRWWQSINQFQFDPNEPAAQYVIAARMVLAVKYNEFTPQPDLETLEAIGVEISRTGDGKVVAELEYDTTP